MFSWPRETEASVNRGRGRGSTCRFFFWKVKERRGHGIAFLLLATFL